MLTGADFTGAQARGANFIDYGTGGVTKAQLYSTASYRTFDLAGIRFENNSLDNVNFVDQNLTRAVFSNASL